MTHSSREGSILISVLALALLLGFLAAIASVVVRAAHGSTRAFADDVRAEQAARAVIEKIVAESGGTKQLGGGTTLALGGLTAEVTITDEAARVDINTAPPELIAGVFRIAGAEPDLAKSLASRVVDWRDDDNERSPDGAERDLYRSSGRPDGPANRPFVHVAELGQVLGMPAAIAAAAAPYLTVASKLEAINPTIADPYLLLALPGTDAAHVADFLKARDEAMVDFDSLAARLGPSVDEYLTEDRSSASRAEILVRFGPRNMRRFEAIVAPGTKTEPYRIVAWQAGVPARVPRALP